MLIKGGVTLITRGYGQTVTLEPYLYAEDPDYPSMQVDIAIRAGNKPLLQASRIYSNQTASRL